MAKALLLSNDKQAGSEKSLVDVLSFGGASVYGVANMPWSNVRNTGTR